MTDLPILYSCAPGQAPRRRNAIPGAGLVAEWLRENGQRAAWIMLDEGVCTEKPQPCCYGSKGE